MSGAAHQGAPRWLSRTPGVPTLAVTAAGQRETAEEPGGAAAPPPTRRRGSGSGSQQALPESERRCQAQTSGQPPPRKAAGRVRAARAEHRFFFLSLGHCCLELLPAPRTLPSRGRPAWDGAWVCLGLGSGEVALGRDAGRSLLKYAHLSQNFITSPCSQLSPNPVVEKKKKNSHALYFI